MPTASQIIESVDAISNDFKSLAFAWHLAAAGVFVFVAAGWIPGVRAIGRLLSLPFISVSALAWYTGNPFNGLMFAMLSSVLFAIASSLPREPAIAGTLLEVMIGTLLAITGWMYPHFLRADSALQYFYESPFGLIPCPTLSLAAGVTLAAGGLSRSWSLCLAFMLTLYGIAGVTMLKVPLDAVLLIGAVALWRRGAQSVRIRARVRDFSSVP